MVPRVNKEHLEVPQSKRTNYRRQIALQADNYTEYYKPRYNHTHSYYRLNYIILRVKASLDYSCPEQSMSMITQKKLLNQTPVIISFNKTTDINGHFQWHSLKLRTIQVQGLLTY